MVFRPEVSIATLLKLTSFVCWSWSYILCVGLRPGKTPEWYSRAVTMVHGSVASIIALWQCDALNLTADRFTDKITLGQYALMLWSWGYFAFDLLWCLVYWSDSYVMLCHHICALIAIDIYMSKENTGCTFPCTMALMEVTNPLLQTRWFMKSEGYTNSILYYVIEGVYLLLFLFLRGVLGTYLTYNILHSEMFDMDEKMITLAFYVVSLIFIFQIIGYVAYKYKTKIEEFKGFLEAIGSISHEWNLWISTFNFLIILFIHLSPVILPNKPKLF
ncbi:TLC domain-containing protein 5-like isoform X2 [Leptidea sinapis]|uniref:TLC domain-containing protein 5-like isoform X2 n=1 Tax=Leptidea sinapis TaxID=189913 RepID=UPI002135B33C|nr:TLC domain-containing protein 5-like isoform X2 [Leptidea sinapis]